MKFEQQIAHLLGGKKESGAETLTDLERRAISARSDLRRLGLGFKRDALNLERPEENDSGRERWEKVLELVFAEAGGKKPIAEKSKEELKADRATLIAKAQEKKDFLPDLAAQYLAEVAKIDESLGADAQVSMDETKKCLAESANLEFPKSSPASLLPEAKLLGIQIRQIATSEMPTKEKIAEVGLSDSKILIDYALALPERERTEFLELIPEEKRNNVEIILDNTLSGVLSSKLISGDDETEQRENVKVRSGEKLKELLAVPDKDATLVVKIISQTVRELEGEDGARLLRELGEKGLKRASDQDENRTRISHTARILRELFVLDQNKGSVLAMKFLGKSDLPNRLFLFFAKQMIDNGYLTDKINNFLGNAKNIAVVKKLIAAYPNQFNTVINTLAQVYFYTLAPYEKEIFSAIKDLESLTPIIYNRYRQADQDGKRKLVDGLRELRPKFFQNIPIRDILPKKDREILAEMVYLAYKPIGMDFEAVKKYIGELEDKTGDLDGYVFPQEGYDFNLVSRKGFVLREGEKVDMSRVGSYKDYFMAEYPQDEKSVKTFSALLERLAKAGTDFKEEELKILFSIISKDELVRNFAEKYRENNPNKTYDYLNELKEILGVYFKDNYSVRLANFLGANPAVEARLQKIFTDEARQKTIERKTEKKGKINWREMLDSREKLSQLLSDFIFQKVLKSLREEINRNTNKFEEKEGAGGAGKAHNGLKAYVSKNIGSFFAKASAGICTSEDIGLFEREDHFHINIVENDDFVRANIQAYIIKDGGGRSLVLRGFNPNINFAEKVDVGAFCEKVIEIAKQFARENNMPHVYITESLGGWHALSNRDNVGRYLIGKYVKEKNKKSFNLKIASSQSVNYIHEV